MPEQPDKTLYLSLRDDDSAQDVERVASLTARLSRGDIQSLAHGMVPTTVREALFALAPNLSGSDSETGN